jgi:hypothetical protein
MKMTEEQSNKHLFTIELISKKQAAEILLQYHYLKDISKGFKSGFNYGLFYEGNLVGAVIYTGFPVPELVNGLFGLPRDDQQGFFELSRLCIEPAIQAKEHNLASWFLARSEKLLRKSTNVKAILSYADSEFHNGIVYRASNFKYYGLTIKKKDFWILQDQGGFIKHSRGKIKGVAGEWRDRSQKHRFLKVFDTTLTIKWNEQNWRITDEND